MDRQGAVCSHDLTKCRWETKDLVKIRPAEVTWTICGHARYSRKNKGLIPHIYLSKKLDKLLYQKIMHFPMGMWMGLPQIWLISQVSFQSVDFNWKALGAIRKQD